MTVRQIDPLQDPRWAAFLERHARATVFHTPGWLEALHRTYGYRAIVLTTAGPGERLTNGVVFCRTKSWLTGKRMVSLPFSDHCEPLVETAEELRCLVLALKDELVSAKAKYLEIRPLSLPSGAAAGLQRAGSFCLHRIDLRMALDELFHRFHKDCIQRKIRRAQREALRFEEGTSEQFLAQFYHLLVLTRYRHQILPQPMAWFRNLLICMGDKATIHLVSKGGKPVAGILTLRYKDTLVYKYGCSDKRFSNVGGMQALFWKIIQEGKSHNINTLDLGRSSWANPGLIKFKDRLGAARCLLTYWRYGKGSSYAFGANWQSRVAREFFKRVPPALSPMAGAFLYRHLS